MPSPADLKRAAEHADAARIMGHIERLERCPGFTEWLAPKLFGAYDSAAEVILAAHARGEPPPASAVSTYHGLHEIVAACRRDKTAAAHRLKLT